MRPFALLCLPLTAFFLGCSTPPPRGEAQSLIEAELRSAHDLHSLNAAIENVKIVSHGTPRTSGKKTIFRDEVDYDIVMVHDLPGLDSPVADSIRHSIAPMVDGCEQKGCRRTRHTAFLLDKIAGHWRASEEFPYPSP